ncbi:hypothetical protein [Streptomyces sp. NPDC058308]|uniref:hypothetical protein n=1 Tax=Streptomyces sp. NPDC058308 TaxID=3346440 RepID=UPI0036DFD35A
MVSRLREEAREGRNPHDTVARRYAARDRRSFGGRDPLSGRDPRGDVRDADARGGLRDADARGQFDAPPRGASRSPSASPSPSRATFRLAFRAKVWTHLRPSLRILCSQPERECK